MTYGANTLPTKISIRRPNQFIDFQKQQSILPATSGSTIFDQNLESHSQKLHNLPKSDKIVSVEFLIRDH